MSEHDFMELVYDMRRAQQLYFKTKDNEMLAHCKRLEKEVDAVIEAQLFHTQLNLFG